MNEDKLREVRLELQGDLRTIENRLLMHGLINPVDKFEIEKTIQKLNGVTRTLLDVLDLAEHDDDCELAMGTSKICTCLLPGTTQPMKAVQP